MKKVFFLLGLTSVVLLALLASECPGSGSGFGGGEGGDSTRKIVLGGTFNTVGVNPHEYIARLYANGSEDTGFTIGAGLNLWAVAFQLY